MAQENRWPLGAVKLTKSLVLSEAISLYWRSKPIIGVEIIKAPHGPVPHDYDKALRQLEAEGRIKITEGESLYEPTSYDSLLPPDPALLALLDKDDWEIIKDITEVCCKKYTATALSDLTHNYYWEIAQLGDNIPLAAYWPPYDYRPQDMIEEELSEAELSEIKAILKEEGLSVP
jgi:uncharacterized phage-associated protein